MLAAAALRLAVIEALCPTAALLAPPDAPIPFPTLAGCHVYDSVAISAEQLDEGDDLMTGPAWTPCVSVYTETTTIRRRGDTSTSAIGNPETDLVFVIELAERAEGAAAGMVDTDAVVNGDALAQLTLAALTAQVREIVVRAPRGAGLRRIMAAAPLIKIEPFGIPEFGVRYMRNVMTVTCQIADDKFTDEPGLPEPLRSLAADLPEGSYAKAKLIELGAAFRATTREQLEAIAIHATANDRPVIRPPAD